ncbi:MAG TPA: C1 family peptidase [Cyclobacteriaceae bacterium]
MRFNKIFLSLSLMCAGISAACAQGLVFDDEAYRQEPAQAYGGARDGEEILRSTFKADLKPYCPTVRQQGNISSCVGWAVGYGAMTIQAAIGNGWNGEHERIDEYAYSAMFLYNQIKLGDCDFGAELNQAFQFIKESGNVFYRDFAADYDCDSVPLEILAEKAALNRITGYSTIFYPDDNAEIKITRVKLALAQKKPVVAGMVLLQNFLHLKPGDAVWYPQIGNTELFGGHAMVVVGYDDSKKAFEVMNSWGRAWANEGFVWIGYDDFANYCKYAYLISTVQEKANYLEGRIQIRKPVARIAGERGSEVIFAPLAFTGNNASYKLKQDGTKFPLEFQLTAEGLRKGSYLYVVSFDKKLNPVVHWPHDENLNRQFVAEYESAAVQADVIAPGKFNVFTLAEAGTEYLCVFNSGSQIKNLGKKLEQIPSLRGALEDRLAKAFANNLPTDFGSYYDDGHISYFGNVSKDEVISLVFEFEIK